MTIRKARVKMLRAKERHEKEIRKEKKVIRKAKVRERARKEKVWHHVPFCGWRGHLARDRWVNNFRQVASDTTHSSSGGASVTTLTVGQQQANVSRQSSSAETIPVVRRVENSEPIIFDL